jgi:hypothetical protein
MTRVQGSWRIGLSAEDVGKKKILGGALVRWLLGKDELQGKKKKKGSAWVKCASQMLGWKVVQN